MPPALLVDINTINLNQIVFDAEAIEQVNPHRHEMRQLDAIIHFDKDSGTVVGYKDITDNEFWVRGHIPGRPIMPGVIMLEAAAQLASFSAKKVLYQEGFLGFSGLEDVKFRLQVIPGSRLYLLGKFLEIRRRQFKLAAQGVVEGQMVFHATIIGMPI
jgi:3-hydroxyacyl-[acyl-carrier-protein] dehydratase